MIVSTQPITDRSALSAEHAEVIKATLPLVGSKINEITPVFYNKMFTAHPELLANTFNRGNQKQGDQQKALAASIATFATMLVTPDAPDPVQLLSRIGHKHVSLGITADQYDIVHEHLFAAIVEVLGAETVTAPVAEAWDAVYWIMANVLIGFENSLYASNDLEAGDVFREVTVTAKKQVSATVWEYTLAGELVSPAPGQYTSVGVVLDDGARQLRQYSLLGGSNTEYRIAVEDNGEVSAFLRDNVAVGDKIEATIAAGDLVLNKDTNPVVLISQGIGSTPMVGMLAGMNPERDVVVLHADQAEATYAQVEEVQGLVEKLPKAAFEIFYRDNDQWLEVAGRIPAGASVYLCGGVEFLKNVREQLDALEEQPRDVNFELFAPNDWLIS
ncbi:globin domain-containing protein [Corynebacterium crudilactis]|uniref:nitric oxide dioxygenase n=1 Tax=Corynebacterium crudilactis TaxID=1652495 RepID=A0A172QWA5_9CORY|nr:globin domain-containing protein [Corynebacterium crudilactis]ANE04989.1 hemin transporter [Corynebacterium crudilactis]